MFLRHSVHTKKCASNHFLTLILPLLNVLLLWHCDYTLVSLFSASKFVFMVLVLISVYHSNILPSCFSRFHIILSLYPLHVIFTLSELLLLGCDIVKLVVSCFTVCNRQFYNILNNIISNPYSTHHHQVRFYRFFFCQKLNLAWDAL